jgi:PAS domain-containing protein
MISVRSIQKWLAFGLSAEQEDRFRQANFGEDIVQARIFILLILLPFVALLVNDYGFLGLSSTFYALLALRLAFTAYTVLFLKSLRELSNYHSYDRAVFFWVLFLALANIAINSTRPENFVAHTIVTVLAVFVIVLAIPNRFTNQVIMALVYTIGQTLIIVPGLRVSPQASSVVFLSMFMVNAIAIASSWLFHFWRRREFLTHEEIQKAKMQTEIQRAHLQAIIDSLPVGLWTVDAAGKMVFINDIASKIWGGTAPFARDVDEYSTYKAWWAETGERIAAEDMPLAHAIRDETLIEKAVDFERFDGTHGTQIVSSAPIKTSDGTIVGGEP